MIQVSRRDIRVSEAFLGSRKSPTRTIRFKRKFGTIDTPFSAFDRLRFSQGSTARPLRFRSPFSKHCSRISSVSNIPVSFKREITTFWSFSPDLLHSDE
ncbi:hypothetical protein HWI79_2772 [Cryptosporidium felis]|nr:hypothetical protein HWI79_2772 [Cryptosporidium felis]